MVYHYSFWCWLCGCLCSWCCRLDSNSALNLRRVLQFRRFLFYDPSLDLYNLHSHRFPNSNNVHLKMQYSREKSEIHIRGAYLLWQINFDPLIFFFNTCHFIFQHLHFYFHFLWLAKFNSKPINVKLRDLHIWFLNSLISRKSFSSHTKIFGKVLVNSISDKFYHHLLKSNFFVNRYTLLFSKSSKTITSIFNSFISRIVIATFP